MKIWLDDDAFNPDAPEKHPPPGWVGVTNTSDFRRYFMADEVEEMSLDHDLGGTETGYDLVKWIGDQVLFHGAFLPKWHVHSRNPVGRGNMVAFLYAVENEIQIGA